jgi:hypothetical protein
VSGYTYEVVEHASNTVIADPWRWPARDSKVAPPVDSVHPIAGGLWRILFCSTSGSGTGQLIVERVSD